MKHPRYNTITVTIQDLHSQNARMYILANYKVDWLDILLIGRLLPMSAYVQAVLYPQAQTYNLHICSRRS